MISPNTQHALSLLETKLREEITAFFDSQQLDSQRFDSPQFDSQQFDSPLSSMASSASLSELIDAFATLHWVESPLYERLTRLDAALCQLDLGLYGLCADCETDIEAERLINDPTEQRCAKCDELYRLEHRLELRLTH